LKLGDLVRKSGKLYRVEEVSVDYALAVPQPQRANRRALLIRPPVTTAYIQLEPYPDRVERLLKSRQKEVAISADGGAQVKYGDGRWSVFPMAGGRTESNRRKH
jgi:hypothetical protein